MRNLHREVASMADHPDYTEMTVDLGSLRAALAARPDSPTLDERARVERDARLRDARDALDMAALWLHRTFDLPARDSQQAESWERKARSGRAALAAFDAAVEEATRP